MIDYLEVSEISGNQVSQEQTERMLHRYLWASGYCHQKDVVELACGTGQGLGILKKVSKSIVASDYSDRMINILRGHYGDKISAEVFDATKMPYQDQTKDILIIFEAIYYLDNLEMFFSECLRVLRPGGKILIATPNIYLFDFVPSEYTFDYLHLDTLNMIKDKYNLEVEHFGFLDYRKTSIWQRVLRPVKKIAVDLNLIPKTMTGKRLIRYFVFGRLNELPNELEFKIENYVQPERITEDFPNKNYKVLYYEMTKKQ